jgi:hypothetical protein
MYVVTPDSTHNTRSVDVSTERDRRNYHYELSVEDREKVDAALAAVTRIKATFGDYVIIGHAIVAARKHADRIGSRKAFPYILAEQRIMPPLDKATVSRLEKIMARLPDVEKWRATLTEPQRFAWSGPTSILNHCDVFKIEREKRRAAAPRNPTRLDNALEENRDLKVQVERYRRAGDDHGFRKEDRAVDIADLLTRVLNENKQHAVMRELVRRLGTKRQREAFGLESDDQLAPPIPAANGGTA